MKKIFGCLVCLCAVLCLAMGVALAEETITVDGIVYEINAYNASYVKMIGLAEDFASEELVVPAYVTDPDDPTISYEVNNVSASALPAGVVKRVTFHNSFSYFPAALIKTSQVEEVYFAEDAKISYFDRSALSGVTTIKKIYLPNESGASDYVFSGCSNLTTIRLPVKTLNAYNFLYGASALTEVIMPEGMTQLGVGLFSPKIERLDFPSTMKRIEGQMCKYLTGLTTLNLNEGLTTIRYEAFLGCTKLKSVVIPRSVTSLAVDAFPKTTTLYVYKDSYAHTFCVENSLTYELAAELNWEVVDEAAKTCRITGYKVVGATLTIPSEMDGYTVVEIGDSAFAGATSLTSVVIPETVTKIGESAFSGCSKLKTANLHGGITSIGQEAFMGTILTGTDLPAGLTELGDRAFSGTNLTTITIPPAITALGNGVFSNCTSLKTLTIPATLTAIGEEAFKGCTYLTELTIPETVTSLGRAAFSGCYRVTSLTLPSNMTVIPEEAFYSMYNLPSLTIPEGVVEIGTKAFGSAGKTGFTLTLPSTLKTIGDSAFIYASMKELVIPEGVETIGASAFERCDEMTTLTLPSTLTSLGNKAFNFCDALLTLEVPGSVKEIGEYVFGYCEAMTTVTLHEGIEQISKGMFDYCSALTSINIPSTVKSIGYRAFYHCDVLPEITLPDGVTTIDGNAFNFCRALAEITLPQQLKTIGEDAFGNCSSLTEIVIPDSVESIGANAFWHCTKLASVKLPAGLQKLENYMFFNCKALTSIDLPDSLTSVGQSALAQTSLTEITFPKGITELPAYVLQNCTALTSVTIPEGVTTIGPNAFNGCTALATLRIPEKTATIDTTAFTGCTGITLSVHYNSPAQTFAEDNSLNHKIRGFAFTSISAPESISLDFGSSKKLSISYAPYIDLSRLDGESIVYTSKDPAIATVDQNGLVRGMKPGNTTIIVKSSADAFVNDTVKVTVTDPTASRPYPLIKTSRSGNTLTISYGVYGGDGPYNLELQCLYDMSTTRKNSIYTNGGQTMFTKTISVPSNSACTVTIRLFVTDRYGNEWGGQATYASVRKTRTVGVGTPEYRVQLVNGVYQYTLVYPSYETVVYYENSYSHYWPISNLIESISISPKNVALIPGQTVQLKATTSNGSNKYIWYSSDPSIVDVSETGVVTLVGMGEAKVYAHTTDGTDLRAECNVLCLEKQIESITVQPLSSVDPDTRTQLMKAIVSPDDASLKAVEWSVKNVGENTASIDENGLLTWNKAGDVRVIATAMDGSGVTGSIDLHWDGVSVEKITVERSADNPMQLSWKVFPANATDPRVTFAVDAPDLLSVDAAGRMVYQGTGTANVRLSAMDGSGVTAVISIECFYHPEHTVTAMPEILPSCTEEGSTGGVYCPVCGDVLGQPESVPPTGHTLTTLPPMAATPEMDGFSHETRCTACDYVRTQCYGINKERIITTPSALKEIGEEAFMGVNAQQVTIANGVTTISSRAFAGCTALRLVIVPDSVTSIANDAFDGVEHVAFICSEGSVAKTYAMEHDIPYFTE